MKRFWEEFLETCGKNKTEIALMCLFVGAGCALNGQAIAEEVVSMRAQRAGEESSHAENTAESGAYGAGETVLGETDGTDSDEGSGDGADAGGRAGSAEAGSGLDDAADANGNGSAADADGNDSAADVNGNGGAGDQANADGNGGAADESAESGNGAAAGESTGQSSSGDRNSADGSTTASQPSGQSGTGIGDDERYAVVMVSDDASAAETGSDTAEHPENLAVSIALEDGKEGCLRVSRRILSQLGSDFRIPMQLPQFWFTDLERTEIAEADDAEVVRVEQTTAVISDGEWVRLIDPYNIEVSESGGETVLDIAETYLCEALSPAAPEEDDYVLVEKTEPKLSYRELKDMKELHGYGLTESTASILHCMQPERMRQFLLVQDMRPLFLLERMVEQRISGYEGEWSVYVHNLTTDESFTVNDQPMKSASVMKLFIMGTVYEAFDEGKLDRTDEVMSLLHNMIVYSDNDASNELLYRLGNGSYADGISVVNAFIRAHGYSDMTIEYNGFNNAATNTSPESFNQVSAKDCGKLLEDIYRRTWVNRTVSNEMESLLLSQSTRYKIPAGLPDGVLCGNKTGEMDDTENDAAIIYSENCDYILVILSNGWSSQNTAISNIQSLSEMIYEYLN